MKLNIFLFLLFGLLVSSCGNNINILLYNYTPSITKITPDVGSLNGEETVEIHGMNFDSLTKIKISGKLCIAQNVVSSELITCKIPHHDKIEKVDIEIGKPLINPILDIDAFNYAIVLGQPNLESFEGLKSGLTNPSAVSMCGGKVFVADTSNNRVLIWNSPISVNHTIPDLVLGQRDFVFANPNTDSDSGQTFSAPASVYCDGTHLFVADTNNNRVLIWNSIPTYNYQPADIVLGQTNFFNTSVDSGGSISDHGLNSPSYVFSDGTRLVVSDSANNRVLIWNTIPITNGTSADLVLGQLLFTTGVANLVTRDLNTLRNPKGITGSSTHLIVADSSNNRVLIWSPWPTTNQEPADIQLGQSSGTAGTQNSGGISLQSFYAPANVELVGSKLIVSDTGNNRVLIWNTVPVANRQAADFVLGQSLTTTGTVNDGGISGQSLSSPLGIGSDGTKLLICDSSNSRVLQWNTTPNGFSSADRVYGQSLLTTNFSRNPSSGFNGKNFMFPSNAYFNGTHLVVTDTNARKVLIWNGLPTSNAQTPDVIVGRTSFTSVDLSTATSSTLNSATGAIIVNGKLIIAERISNRVLIWNSVPTVSGTPADVILGQPNDTSTTANNGGISDTSLNQPYGVASDGTRLFVSDQANNRIMVWNSIPTANTQPADFVLGQPNFNTNGTNNPNSASGLSNPRQLTFSEGKLLVGELNNNRAVGWNSPTSNVPPDFVLGQPDFNSTTAPTNSSFTASYFGFAYGTFNNGKLYLGNNSRVLIFDSAPTTSGSAATSVLGQDSLTSNISNSYGLNGNSIGTAFLPHIHDDYLFIPDVTNARVIIRPVP